MKNKNNVTQGMGRRWLALGAAILASLVLLTVDVTVTSSDAEARGGRGGGREGGGTGGGRSSRGRSRMRGRSGGVGRIGGNSFGMGRFKGGGNRTAKEWQAIQDQEDRKAQIQARRDQLMMIDRTKSQEAILAAGRAEAAQASALGN